MRVHAGLGAGWRFMMPKCVIASLVRARAGELLAVEVDEAHVLGRHEALADERGRAEGEIVADADGDVAAVAVGVVTLPEPAADVADAALEFLIAGELKKRSISAGVFGSEPGVHLNS
jgi:hypothetical protein